MKELRNFSLSIFLKTNHWVKLQEINISKISARGSPHTCISLDKRCSNIKDSSADEHVSYIDKVICTRIPDENSDSELYYLITRLKINHHTRTVKSRVKSPLADLASPKKALQLQEY